MEPRALAGLERSASSDETQPATFVANGQVYEGVRVRYRGQWARSWPKKPLKIFFDREKFAGQHCLNLNSGWHDPALVREVVAYRVYAASGVPSPQARMVRVNLNGKFHGIYVEVEQPAKAFLKCQNLKGAEVFKATSGSNRADERDLGPETGFRAHYEKVTQKTEGYQELQRFCHDLAQATNQLEFFTQRVDVDKYINYLAATALLQNWDCFNKNHFLVYDARGSRKWVV